MGGLYGDHADEAGVLFGLTDSRGWVFFRWGFWGAI